jgi:cephalosporin hydroxylase
VIGIDIELRPHNRSALESHPLAHMVRVIEGSSIANDVVGRVREHVRDYERVLVCLDSNHTADHVLAELHAYAPLVSAGSYCVVFDTIIERMPDTLYENRPWRSGNSPMTAVDRFLADLANREFLGTDRKRLAFEIDTSIDSKLQTSVAPRGFLHRVAA